MVVSSDGLCAWCGAPLGGEYFALTFPEKDGVKDQLRMHVECVYRYREAMER